MRAKLIKIGRSKGIRIPKALIELFELGNEVELKVKKSEIVISRVRKVREGWAEDAKLMAILEPEGFVHEWPMEDLVQHG